MAEKEEEEEERKAEEEEEEGGRRELGKKEEEETEDHSSISVSVLRAARREGSRGTEERTDGRVLTQPPLQAPKEQTGKKGF